ncbi:thionin-like protein 2 [Lycium barbarum]|uniref:thionin-like protein 2 n=1 Tax=Lycium barbarum TaxID=112863 RepID=UPI00293F1552|nr:thionin-like protein 2 [Lycium barbarum]
MGRKGNDVFFALIIAFVMFLTFSTLKSITADDCLINCMRKCPAEDYQCYERCGWSCPHNVTTSSDYCNLGCSFHHCAKLSKDENQWQACRDNCATNICNAKTE